MSNLTVHDLGELMTPAADDEILIWDVSAAQAMKIKRSTLVGATITGAGTIATGGYTFTIPATGTAALLGTAQSFTAAQTFTSEVNLRQHTTSNLWSIDAADGTTLTMADSYVFQFSTTTVFAGLVMVINTTDGGGALFMCSGGQVVKISDGSSVYSTTYNTSSKTNVYYDGGSGEYRMQNKTGGSRTYNIFSIRLRGAS